MQNSIEKKIEEDKKNLRMFTQCALKSGINNEDVAKVTAITNESRDAKEQSELQEGELMIH